MHDLIIGWNPIVDNLPCTVRCWGPDINMVLQLFIFLHHFPHLMVDIQNFSVFNFLRNVPRPWVLWWLFLVLVFSLFVRWYLHIHLVLKVDYSRIGNWEGVCGCFWDRKKVVSTLRGLHWGVSGVIMGGLVNWYGFRNSHFNWWAHVRWLSQSNGVVKRRKLFNVFISDHNLPKRLSL